VKERDRSPIDQKWIQDYTGRLMNVAEGLASGAMSDALLLRVSHVMDMVEAWQLRNSDAARKGEQS